MQCGELSSLLIIFCLGVLFLVGVELLGHVRCVSTPCELLPMAVFVFCAVVSMVAAVCAVFRQNCLD